MIQWIQSTTLQPDLASLSPPMKYLTTKPPKLNVQGSTRLDSTLIIPCSESLNRRCAVNVNANINALSIDPR